MAYDERDAAGRPGRWRAAFLWTMRRSTIENIHRHRGRSRGGVREDGAIADRDAAFVSTLDDLYRFVSVVFLPGPANSFSRRCSGIGLRDACVLHTARYAGAVPGEISCCGLSAEAIRKRECRNMRQRAKRVDGFMTVFIGGERIRWVRTQYHWLESYVANRRLAFILAAWVMHAFRTAAFHRSRLSFRK